MRERRVPKKHILTLQQGITGNQLSEMQAAGISLVVPSALHGKYPKEWQHKLFDVHGFIQSAKQRLAG